MKKAETTVELKPIKIDGFTVSLVGDSPLICHRWSEKAKKQILDAQMKKAKTAKEARNPVQDFAESLYWLTPQPQIEDEADFEAALIAGAKFGFPATAFKQAAVSAGYRAGVLKNKVEAYAAFHIDAELVEIIGIPTLREDMVKIGMGVADIRFRAEFKMWETTLDIRYNASVISPEQLINLLQIGGFGVGCGEWRPEKGGSYGQFHVKTS